MQPVFVDDRAASAGHELDDRALEWRSAPRRWGQPLHSLCTYVGELRCSMYDNVLIPVALANKLVSLSDFPSQRILTTFVRQGVKP